MISLFQPGEAVTMAGFNQRLQGILSALPSQNLKIAAGSYVGTGASGSSNPNTLSFNFAPVLVIVWTSSGDLKGFLFMSPNSSQEIIWWGNISSSGALGAPVNTSFLNGGKTVSWYNPSNFLV